MSTRLRIEAERDSELAARGLPELCYRHEPSVGIVVIQRGITGYSEAPNAPRGLADAEAAAWVARQNDRLGVTRAQAEAMFAGSAFGWHTRLAFPAAHG